jgi:hypothetical protein
VERPLPSLATAQDGDRRWNRCRGSNGDQRQPDRSSSRFWNAARQKQSKPEAKSGARADDKAEQRRTQHQIIHIDLREPVRKERAGRSMLFVTISRAMLVKGAGLREIARPFALLAVYAVVVLTFAVRQYKKRLA